MAINLGNLTEDSAHSFTWDTIDAGGASITRFDDGTVTVWKDGDSTDATVLGVVDTEDEVTGIHRCEIDTSAAAFYETGEDYSVVLLGATIDGQPVNATIAYFSIENRFDEVNTTQISGSAPTADKLESIFTGSGIADDVDIQMRKLSIINDDGVGMIVTGTTIGLDVNATAGIGVDIDGTAGGITATAVSGGGIVVVGGGGAPGMSVSGGTGGGAGFNAIGGSTGGAGIKAQAQADNDAGMELIAHGTGADLLLTTSGTIEDGSGNIVSVSMGEILGTALTEGPGGQLADRFSDFFDEAAAVFTVGTALADFKATGFATSGALDTHDTDIKALVAAEHVTTDALIVSSHMTTDVLIASEHSTTDALIASEHSTTDTLIVSEHSTTDALIVAGIGSVPTANENADALLGRNDGIETGVTPKQAWQRIGAVVAGKISGAGTGTEIFVGMDVAVPRVIVTADAAGNRTEVVYP